jgi:hypothetical protein
LIVVDDTPAMAAYRDRLATLPARLAARLESYTRRWVDFRIAVTSNDGRLRRLPDVAEPWLADAFAFDYTRHRNYNGTLADALTALMTAERTRSITSQPLEAARRALESGSELVRDRAGLMIVTVTASDDASPLPVGDYVRWMKMIDESASWNREVLNSGLYAQPAARLDEYYKHVPGRIVTSIDGDNFEAVIPWVPDTPWAASPPCLEVDDLEPSTPELDYECAMMVLVNDTWRTVPECDANGRVESTEHELMTSTPPAACWSIRPEWNCSSRYGGGNALVLSGYTSPQHPAYRFDCRAP